jgi:hypothetical protein
MTHEFRTKVELGGKTATGLEVPERVVEALGTHKRPPVKVTINGFTYRSTVSPYGGRFFLPLSAENRSGAKVAAGDDVTVTLELDREPREVSVPADFQAALDVDLKVAQKFAALSYSHRKEHVRAIEEAKTSETRQRRIAKALDILRKP